MARPANRQHSAPSSGRQSPEGALRHHQQVTPAASNQPKNKKNIKKRERPKG
jgi:hypothetical protein